MGTDSVRPRQRMEEYPNIPTHAHWNSQSDAFGPWFPLTKNDSIRLEVFIPPIKSKLGMIYKTVELQEEL